MRWQNQYIDELNTKPDYIFPCRNNVIPPEEKKRLLSRLEGFSKIYCEPCSGSGRHLVERARQNPDSAWIGFELRFKRTFKTAEKAEKLGLKNVFLVRTNAHLILEILPPESVDGLYINFPDPWARKKKWNKHRIINPEFLKTIHTLLKPEGFFAYKTDHEEYFDTTHEMINKLKIFEEIKYTRDLHKSEFDTDNVQTEFERLFISQSLPSYMLEVRK